MIYENQSAPRQGGNYKNYQIRAKRFQLKKIEKKEKHGWENKITNYLLVNCFEPFYEPFYLFRGFQEACKLCLNMQS